MFKQLVVLLTLSLGLLVSGVTAQTQDNTGQFRLVQIFYSEAALVADDEVLIESLKYSVATDYFELEAGIHAIGVATVDAATIREVDIQAGHSYTIVTMGEFETGTPTLLVIDETTDFMGFAEGGNNAIIVQNVPGAVPVDVYFVDELKIENLTFGAYGVADAPLGEFNARATMIGQPDSLVFESTYFAVPNTTSLAYLAGTFPDAIGRFFFTTTPDNTLAYLTAHTSVENSSLTTFYELLHLANMLEQLGGEGEFTIFAPRNLAFDGLTPETLETVRLDPVALAAMLGYHIIPEYIPPYKLDGEQTWVTLNGAEVTTFFDPGTPPTVNGVVTGLQHRTSNGMIYLIDEVLTPPAE